jgi:hypothetical protein
MSNENLITRLQAGVGALLDTLGAELVHSSENESQFSLQLYPDTASLGHILTGLAAHADLFAVSLEYQIQQGSGTGSLTSEGVLAENWDEDPDLSPPDLDPRAAALFANLAEQLARTEKCIRVDALVHDLDRLMRAGASVEVSLHIFLNKAELMQNLGWPQGVSGLLYIVADKFLQMTHDADLPTLGSLLVHGSEHTLILMLGDASGVAKGPNIRVCGRDHWTSPGDLDFQASKADGKKVRAAISFRSEEGQWEIPASGLTPHLLYIEEASLTRADILEVISRLRDRLSIAYLADRVQTNGRNLVCEFRGYKRVQITIPPLGDHTASLPLFRLFAWAYENSSSDKLGIVRQIISLQLGDIAVDNFLVLSERAGDILGTAKSNFQLFLRRSVELYFDKRLKVSEYLQKFSEEVGDSVSKLTSELVSNLYKTVGVILGVVIAALVDPKQTVFIAYLTSLLYLVYMGFIVAYLLPSAYLRFRGEVQDYEHSVSGLRDILSDDEILRLQDTSFRRERWTFLFFFGLTNVLYALLGTVAYLLMRNFLGML